MIDRGLTVTSSPRAVCPLYGYAFLDAFDRLVSQRTQDIDLTMPPNCARRPHSAHKEPAVTRIVLFVALVALLLVPSRGAAQARVTGADLQGTVVDQSGTALVLRQRNRLVQDVISRRVSHRGGELGLSICRLMIGGERHREMSIFVPGCREFNQYFVRARPRPRSFPATIAHADIAAER